MKRLNTYSLVHEKETSVYSSHLKNCVFRFPATERKSPATCFSFGENVLCAHWQLSEENQKEPKVKMTGQNSAWKTGGIFTCNFMSLESLLCLLR